MFWRIVSNPRGAVLAVAVWLLGVEVVRSLTSTVISFAGLTLVLIGSLVVTYCRWRALRNAPSPENPVSYYFWSYLPSIPAVVAAIGMLWKVTHTHAKPGLRAMVWDLGPAILELGVPLVLLIYIYVALGKAVSDRADIPVEVETTPPVS